ncbi:MAG: selenide, water dikinase SelD [Bryobacteraceae bacterium]
MSPKLLDQVLCGLPRVTNENVLVGYDTADDAGVYQIAPDLALVQTVDFFTPIVDDPFTYGAIAAANSLSDVYAMGGAPISALSLVAYPAKGDMNVLREILRGGAEKIRESGAVILGGHSVNDDEIKFGYAITGRVHPDKVWTNAGARAGDVLVFTKRIGTGVIATALKRGLARDEDVAASVASMLTLNRDAAAALTDLPVHSATDITGFGLLGHAREMALASCVRLEISASGVPLLNGALDCARAGAVPGGLKNNREYVSRDVETAPDLDPALVDLLYDPQTSGGLLVALPEAAAATFLDGYPAAHPIGRVLAPVEDRAAVSVVA